MNSMLLPEYYYPNKMGRVLLLATEEILGQENLKKLLGVSDLAHRIDSLPPNDLELQFSFEELGRLQTGLETFFGPRGGQGLALRSGQACVKYGLREFGPLLGLTEMAFRLLPGEGKLRTGVQIFAEAFNRYSDQRVRVEEDDQHFFWHIERCPVCWGRHADQAVCSLAVGVLQESLFWVSGGKNFKVEEQLCIAKGDPTCTFVIDKRPMD